jgi:hypothetical protein
MWKRVRERLLSGVAILLMVAWLACTVGIAIWVVRVTGIDVQRKSAVGLVVLIYLVPIGAVVAVDEFVIRRIRYGPPGPGRRKRGTLDPDQWVPGVTASEGLWRRFASMVIWRIRVMNHWTLMHVGFLGFGLAPVAIGNSFSMRWELAVVQWTIVGSAVGALVGPWILHWIQWKRRGTTPPWLKMQAPEMLGTQSRD